MPPAAFNPLQLHQHGQAGRRADFHGREKLGGQWELSPPVPKPADAVCLLTALHSIPLRVISEQWVSWIRRAMMTKPSCGLVHGSTSHMGTNAVQQL